MSTDLHSMLVETLFDTELDSSAEQMEEELAKARLVLSGVRRFEGNRYAQDRYMLAMMALFEQVPVENAVLAAVEFAEPRSSDAVH